MALVYMLVEQSDPRAGRPFTIVAVSGEAGVEDGACFRRLLGCGPAKTPSGWSGARVTDALARMGNSSAFGLTAALMKGMTNTFSSGIATLLTSWELYAMIAAGALGMFLVQSALNAGRLIAAQPGLTAWPWARRRSWRPCTSPSSHPRDCAEG